MNIFTIDFKKLLSTITYIPTLISLIYLFLKCHEEECAKLNQALTKN